MHYYKRHLGDYAKDTGHLTALEHGVYTLLLDWYYANERPIPPDKATRIARGNPDETQTVLTEFFKLTDAGWIHSYADRVIEEYNVKAERNREIGKLGGRPKTQTVSKPNPDVTLATSHKPLTTNQKSKSSVRPTASRFPEFWAVYPNKKGKAEAEKRWRKEKLDAIADEIIRHVHLMIADDDGWSRGYAPMGSTYLNQSRWTDVPQAAPQERKAPPGKRMQAILTLEAMKHGTMDAGRDRGGLPEARMLGFGSDAAVGADARNGNGVDGGDYVQPWVRGVVGQD